MFDNAWASPVCSPTRGTIVSGQYGFRTGVTTVGNVLPTSTVTLFDRLTAESPDYTHAFFGKYHLGGGSIDPRPRRRVPGRPRRSSSTCVTWGSRPTAGSSAARSTDYFNWTTYDINGPALANTTYSTTVAHGLRHRLHSPAGDHEARQALVPLSGVQRAPRRQRRQQSVPGAAARAPSCRSELGRQPGAGRLPDQHSGLPGRHPGPGHRAWPIAGGGRLRARRLVIFVGDNGVPPPVKDTATGLRDAKGSVYEGGVRVPLIVAGAGVTRRGREDNLFVTSRSLRDHPGRRGGAGEPCQRQLQLEAAVQRRSRFERTHALVLGDLDRHQPAPLRG